MNIQEVNSRGSILANFYLCQLNISHKQMQKEIKPTIHGHFILGTRSAPCFDFMVGKDTSVLKTEVT
jgi:hypothetical protein